MLAKVALLFLAGMVLIALVSRALFPVRGRKSRLTGPATCPRCGAYLIGKGPCACKKGKA